MDEQHNYQEYYKRQPEQPVKRPRGRLLRIWGPLLIKFLIVYIVSVLFAAVMMGQYFESTVGLDTQSMNEFLAVEENYTELYNEIWAKSIQYMTPMEGLAALLTIPIMLFMFYRDRVRERLAGIVPAEKTKLWKYIAIIFMAAALCIGINNLLFISNLASLSSAYEETMTALYSPSFGIQLLCLGIIIPICEELVFRGLMYKRLREYSGFVGATIYSALVFSFVHVNLVQAVYAFFMAVVFAFLYEKYGSVKAPIVAHIVTNTVAVFATEYELFDRIMTDPMQAGIITVACAFVSACMYVFIQRMDDEPQDDSTVDTSM